MAQKQAREGSIEVRVGIFGLQRRRWQPLLEEGVRLLGVESRCASVRSSGLAVLDLER